MSDYERDRAIASLAKLGITTEDIFFGGVLDTTMKLSLVSCMTPEDASFAVASVINTCAPLKPIRKDRRGRVREWWQRTFGVSS